MTDWVDVDTGNLPTKSGTYACISRGATDLKLMRFSITEMKWKSSNGIETRKVTHWFEIPTLPKAIRMNILLRKATEQGLDIEEKLELSNLLRE